MRIRKVCFGPPKKFCPHDRDKTFIFNDLFYTSFSIDHHFSNRKKPPKLSKNSSTSQKQTPTPKTENHRPKNPQPRESKRQSGDTPAKFHILKTGDYRSKIVGFKKLQ